MNKELKFIQSQNYMERKRIHSQLLPGKEANLINVIAGSGYGKTSSVLSYLSSYNASILWLPITLSDNYTSHFWENFVNSYQAIDSEQASYLMQMGFPSDIQSLHCFAKAIAYEAFKEKPLVMVFDDFHMIKNDAIISLINNLILMHIENVYIYIISRTKPAILETETLSESTIVTDKDLCFTLTELEEYFTKKEITLPFNMLKEIHRKTEGWPFGVYLAGLTAENSKNLLNNSMHFSDVLIYETIEQYIFSKYSPKLQNFILRLSLLEFYPIQMMQELYQAETNNYMHILTENAFIRYNEHTKSWYFHQMFRDFLHSKHDELTQKEKTKTYRTAAQWFEKRSLVVDALYCYKKCGDCQSSWNIIWNLLPDIFTVEFAQLLIDTLNSFPEQFKKEIPNVYAAIAALHNSIGKLNEGWIYSKNMIKQLENAPKTVQNMEAIGELYINLAFLCMQIGDPSFAYYFKKSRKYLKNRSNLYNRPFMFLLNGDPVTFNKGAENELTKWVEAYESAEPDYTYVLWDNMYGIDVLTKALAFYYQCNLKRAEEHAILSVYKGMEKQQADIVCNGYYLLSRLAFYRGDYSSVMNNLKKCKEYADQNTSVAHLHIADVAAGWFYVKIGMNQYVPDWIIHDKTYAMTEFHSAMGFERIVKANFLLNKESYYELIPYLHQSEAIYIMINKYPYRIHTHIMLAISHYYMNNIDEAIEEIHTCYQMTHKNDLIMFFASYGKQMRTMLEGIKKLKEKTYQNSIDDKLQEIPDAWIDLIYSKSSTFAKRANLLREQFIAQHPEYQTADSALSKRETDILRAMCEGLTREEIADFMNISTNTIKSTLKVVYAKLGAINGSHAVRIAMLRGII